MRGVFGLLGLVVVLAIVLINARNSTATLTALPHAESAADAGGAAPQAQTEAVRNQVQGLVDRSAQAASEAAAP
jgi:hypothetical protein